MDIPASCDLSIYCRWLPPGPRLLGISVLSHRTPCALRLISPPPFISLPFPSRLLSVSCPSLPREDNQDVHTTLAYRCMYVRTTTTTSTAALATTAAAAAAAATTIHPAVGGISSESEAGFNTPYVCMYVCMYGTSGPRPMMGCGAAVRAVLRWDVMRCDAVHACMHAWRIVHIWRRQNVCRVHT